MSGRWRSWRPGQYQLGAVPCSTSAARDPQPSTTNGGLEGRSSSSRQKQRVAGRDRPSCLCLLPPALSSYSPGFHFSPESHEKWNVFGAVRASARYCVYVTYWRLETREPDRRDAEEIRDAGLSDRQLERVLYSAEEVKGGAASSISISSGRFIAVPREKIDE